MLRLALVILWPSFLSAIVAEGLFFSYFDPHELAMADASIELPAIAVYTIGFFCFWIFCAIASGLTYYLQSTPAAGAGKT